MSSVKELAEMALAELNYETIRAQMQPVEAMPGYRVDMDEWLRRELSEHDRILREYGVRRNLIIREWRRQAMTMNIHRPLRRDPMIGNENDFAFPANTVWNPANTGWNSPQNRPRIPAMPEEPHKTGLATLEMDSAEREFLKEYHRIASKVGFACKEARVKVTEAELVEWLQAEAMPVYDYQAVKGYLDGIVVRYNAEHYPNSKLDWEWIPVAQYGKLDKPIPIPVLMTIEKVVNRFGDRVEMSISDIAKYPDPFLALRVPGSERWFVIERWDEPKFRDKP